MNKIKFKELLPHIAAFVIILILMAIYFKPVLSGKVLNQQDVKQWKGAFEETRAYREKVPGANPQWTNAMFSGMPAYQIGVEYPNNYTSIIAKVMSLGLPSPLSIIFLLFICFYILLLSFRINPWLCIAGALAYTFSSFNIINIEAGHDTKGLAIAYAPLVLAGVNFAFRGHLLRGAAITCAGLALELYVNHLQITYYLAIAILIWAIIEGIYAMKDDRLKSFLKTCLVLAGVAVVAAGANITNLLVTAEYGKETMRGKSELTNTGSEQGGGLEKGYAFKWSNGLLEPLTILIPNFHGGGSVGALSTKSEVYKYLNNTGQPNAKEYVKQIYLYWGDQQFTSGPIYFGALICFLFVLGLYIVKGPVKWWIAIAALFFILLSMGKNLPVLSDLFFDYFPLYNKFRSVTFMMVIAQILFPLMAILAVDRFINWSGDHEPLKKPLLYSLYIVGGICLIFALVPGIFFDFSPDPFGDNDSDKQLTDSGWPEVLMSALRADRESLLKMDAFRSLVIVGLGFGVMWFFMKQKLRKEYVYVAVILLVLTDLWMVDKRYLSESDFRSKRGEAEFTPTAADTRILSDKENYRVLNLTVNPWADASTSYYHKSVGGYHGAKLKRYQELKDSVMDRELKWFSTRGFSDSVLKASNSLNMLNTRYIIVSKDENGVVRNPHALGSAWFVKNHVIVKNADAEIDSLGYINPATTALVDESFAGMLANFKPAADSTASIKLIEHSPEYSSYQSESKTPQLAVFSEIYYAPGWHAYIDGQPVEYFRVNYVLRGMIVPAGSHKIEFKYQSSTFETGEKISLGSSLLMLGLLGFSIFRGIRAYFRKEEEA